MFARVIKRSPFSNMMHLSSRALTGSTMPSGSVFRLTDDGPTKVSTDDIFKGKKVVLFSFVGAFTGTCQNKQVPSFDAKVDEFKKKGIDAVYAMSVADVFVLKAFQAETNANNLQFIQDFNAEYSQSLGKTVDLSGIGFGLRTGRYALYADNGVVKKYFEEPNPGEMTVTDADTILNSL
eukprot:274640_1